MVSDLRGQDELQRNWRRSAACRSSYHLGGEEKSWLDGIDCVVPSPGVPMDNRSAAAKRAARQIPVLSEIELAYRFFTRRWSRSPAPTVKARRRHLIGEMLKANGKRIFLGGNLARRSSAPRRETWDWGVIEISSFQLEWVDEFRPRIAVLLNITEDHLDRYATFADYCRRQGANLRGADISATSRFSIATIRSSGRCASGIAARVISFGFQRSRRRGLRARAMKSFGATAQAKSVSAQQCEDPRRA